MNFIYAYSISWSKSFHFFPSLVVYHKENVKDLDGQSKMIIFKLNLTIM